MAKRTASIQQRKTSIPLPTRFERLHKSKPADHRNPFQVDRDRVMYSSAFRRLANVTQVVAADEVHVFHNRLTHSLQVAQVARRIAELLLQKPQPNSDVALSPDVCEAASLAHDLGHPPFGHIAEQTLNKLALAAGLSDGFEGNAQSFRIVTKLAAHDVTCEGLNLTRATLDAIQKYPWLKGKNKAEPSKWGAYESERSELHWTREMHPMSELTQCLEASIMDWADDVTYSVHDVEDFYRAGLIPLDALGASQSLRDDFYRDVFDRVGHKLPPEWKQSEMIKIFEVLAGGWRSFTRYRGAIIQRQTLKSMASTFIGGYVNAVKVMPRTSAKPTHILIDRWKRIEVFMLKQLTWHYVILNPALASQQLGQQKIVGELFAVYKDCAWDSNDSLLRLFPYMYREKLLDQREGGDSQQALLRTVVDFIAGMTERQAIDMHHRLSGVVLGSALSHSLR